MTDEIQDLPDEIQDHADPRLREFLTSDDGPPTKRETAMYFAVRHLLDTQADLCRVRARVGIMSALTMVAAGVLLWFEHYDVGWPLFVTGFLVSASNATE